MLNPRFGTVKEMSTLTVFLYMTNDLWKKNLSEHKVYGSEIFMGLQPCGSDVIRQSAAGGNAMI